jgi:hypothetical protein
MLCVQRNCFNKSKQGATFVDMGWLALQGPVERDVRNELQVSVGGTVGCHHDDRCLHYTSETFPYHSIKFISNALIPFDTRSNSSLYEMSRVSEHAQEVCETGARSVPCIHATT